MNFRHLILAFLFTLTAPMFARDNTDRLTMNNGDSMTCEIKGLDGGVLYVSFDYIDGTASVDWSKVARVESTRLFVVKTEDGSVYTGALKTAEMGAGRPVQIHVVRISFGSDSTAGSALERSTPRATNRPSTACRRAPRTCGSAGIPVPAWIPISRRALGPQLRRETRSRSRSFI